MTLATKPKELRAQEAVAVFLLFSKVRKPLWLSVFSILSIYVSPAILELTSKE